MSGLKKRSITRWHWGRDLDVALEAGLQHAVLIPAESPLGKQKLHLNNSTQNLLD